MFITDYGDRQTFQRYYVNKSNEWTLSERKVFTSSDILIESELLVTDKDGNKVEDERLDNDVWQFNWEEANIITKRDLHDGLVLEMADGECYLLCNNTLIGENNWMPLYEYDDHLLYKDNYKYDIVAVYDVSGCTLDTMLNILPSSDNCVWRRD